MPSPRRTSRLFRCTKWTCTLLAAGMVIVWAASLKYQCWWYRGSDWASFRLHCFQGAVYGTVGRPQSKTSRKVSVQPTEFFIGKATSKPAAITWLPTPQYRPQVDGTAVVLLPLWLATLVCAVPAAWMWRVDIKRRSVKEGCCAKCGYSLVGTPAERPCPECGTSVAPKPGRV